MGGLHLKYRSGTKTFQESLSGGSTLRNPFIAASWNDSWELAKLSAASPKLVLLRRVPIEASLISTMS
jgi:hypothetical protein